MYRLSSRFRVYPQPCQYLPAVYRQQQILLCNHNENFNLVPYQQNQNLIITPVDKRFTQYTLKIDKDTSKRSQLIISEQHPYYEFRTFKYSTHYESPTYIQYNNSVVPYYYDSFNPTFYTSASPFNLNSVNDQSPPKPPSSKDPNYDYIYNFLDLITPNIETLFTNNGIPTEQFLSKIDENVLTTIELSSIKNLRLFLKAMGISSQAIEGKDKLLAKASQAVNFIKLQNLKSQPSMRIDYKVPVPQENHIQSKVSYLRICNTTEELLKKKQVNVNYHFDSMSKKVIWIEITDKTLVRASGQPKYSVGLIMGFFGIALGDE